MIDQIELDSNFLEINKIDLILVDELLKISNCNDQYIKNVLLLMCANNNRGSSCLILESQTFLNKIYKLIPDFKTEEFIKNIEIGIYDKLIGKNIESFKPIIYYVDKNKHYLYFHKYFKKEQKVKDIFSSILSNSIDFEKIEETKIKIIRETIHKNYNGLSLNDFQKLAVVISTLNNFTIISGGAGSGKTTTIIIILLALLNVGFNYEDITIATPTGKAANMLKESLINFNIKTNQNIKLEELNISTIHRILKYNISKGNFYYNAANKLPYKVIIIDETSMVDIATMAAILEATKKDTKLILIGDKDQLPSVDVGTLLPAFIIKNKKPTFTDSCAKMINRNFNININLEIENNRLSNRIIFLEGNNRANNDVIKRISESIINNEDILNQFQKKEISKKDIFFKEKNIFLRSSNNENNEIKFIIKEWVSIYYSSVVLENYTFQKLLMEISEIKFSEEKLNSLLEKVFIFLSFAKILTIVKEGITGCNIINNLAYDYLIDITNQQKEASLIAGTPIIVTRNDYANELFNGDIGIVLKNCFNEKKVFFKSINGYKAFDLSSIGNYEFAFAMTVHKSQGSGYNNIFFIIPDNIDNPLLTRETIYTAITRAIENITIYGKEEIFKKAIERRIERESGFYFD